MNVAEVAAVRRSLHSAITQKKSAAVHQPNSSSSTPPLPKTEFHEESQSSNPLAGKRTRATLVAALESPFFFGGGSRAATILIQALLTILEGPHQDLRPLIFEAASRARLYAATVERSLLPNKLEIGWNVVTRH